jgi:hypothetical protein
MITVPPVAAMTGEVFRKHVALRHPTLRFVTRTEHAAQHRLGLAPGHRHGVTRAPGVCR